MSRFARAPSNEALSVLARAAGEIFHWPCIKSHKSRLLDVHMHPNKFRCAWLGQAGPLKVVSKGFEGAMMLGCWLVGWLVGRFSDVISLSELKCKDEMEGRL